MKHGVQAHEIFILMRTILDWVSKTLDWHDHIFTMQPSLPKSIKNNQAISYLSM